VQAETRRARALYDRLAPRYDRMEQVANWLLLGRLRRQVLAAARGRTVEVAAGTGSNLPYYPPGMRPWLVDVSEGMLRRAVEKGAAGRVILADAEQLPFGDATFATVVATLSGCTVADPLRYYAELGRVCRPDGRVLLLEHGLSSWRPLAALQRLGLRRQLRRFACHGDRDAEALVRLAGLRLERSEQRALGVLRLITARPAAG